MAKETKILNTKTIITRRSSSISIYTFYQNCIQYLNAFISDVLTSNYKENELVFQNSNYDDIFFYIDSNGNLIVKSSDTKSFVIDDTGELVMTDSNPICT